MHSGQVCFGLPLLRDAFISKCLTLAGAVRVQLDPLVGQLNESNPCFPSESIRLVSAFFPPGLFGALWRRGRLNLCKRSQRAVSGSTEPLTEATDLRSDPLTCSRAGWHDG